MTIDGFASLEWMDDKRALISIAAAHSPDGPFMVASDPIIDPAEDPLPGVLGAGSIKVLKTEDGFVALQNKIYRDGTQWESARAAPLLAPDVGWRQSHVYARDGWHKAQGRERIGRLHSV